MTANNSPDNHGRKRDRRDLLVSLLLLILGIACLLLAAQVAITPEPIWRVAANMLSGVNPDTGEGGVPVGPLRDEALTPLPKDILTPMGTPSPAPGAVAGQPLEVTATPQEVVAVPTSLPTATRTPTLTSTPTRTPTPTPTATRLPTLTPTGMPTLTPLPTFTLTPLPTNTSAPPPPPTNTPVPPTPTDTPTPTPTDTPIPDPPPDPPINLRAAPSDSRVTLAWDNPAPPPDLAGYRVYSSTAVIGPFTLHATVPITQYLDTSVINATIYYYYVTAFDIASNESISSTIVSAEPHSLTPYTFTTTIDTCAGPADCSPATGPPDGNPLDLQPGEYVILDFGDGHGITDGPGYDMVLYENPQAGGIWLDYITIEISYDGSTWYSVFAWDGVPGGVSGTNVDCYANDDPLCNGVNGGEAENEAIPSGALYNNTGVAIDIGPWTPVGYSFRYVRLRDGGGTDAAQIDAVERLN